MDSRLRGNNIENNFKQTEPKIQAAVKKISNVSSNMNVSEKARKIIESDIINGKLYPRQRLVEKEIAARLKISRGPVREALKQLEVKGLVTKLPTRGLAVRAYTKEDINETFQVREALETVAIQLVCRNITPKALDNLSKYNDNHQKEVDKYLEATKSGKRYNINPSWSALFHTELFKSCGNARLVHYIEEMRDIERLAYVSRFFVESEYRLFYEQHRCIIENIRQQDAAGAVAAVKSHLDTIRNIYIRYL